MFRCRRFLVICALLGLALGLGTSSIGRSAAAAACTPGPQVMGGVRVQVFCGTATATIRIGGRTIRVKNGECGPNVPGYFSVRVGILTFSPSHPKYAFFAAYVDGDRGGKYRDQRLAYEFGRHHYEVLPNTVKLAASVARGTFVGRIRTPGSGSAARSRAERPAPSSSRAAVGASVPVVKHPADERR
jgi:hypothetical protein